MICTNCYEADYITVKKDVALNFNRSEIVIKDVECQVCPSCNETIYSQKQLLEFEKKRIATEFSLVPSFKPHHLKLLRKIINASLEEICDLLQIGKNTYGRWERGDIEITPSMNLLVYHLIEKIPEAKVNLLENYMEKEIAVKKPLALLKDVSLGEFLKNICAATKLYSETVSSKIETDIPYLNKLENNEIIPEEVPVNIMGNIVSLFRLTMDELVSLLNNSIKVITLRADVSFVHARKDNNLEPSVTAQSKTVNKVLELLKDELVEDVRTVSSNYIKQIIAYLDKKEICEVQNHGN